MIDANDYLDRNRKPRVHIKYKLFDKGAIKKKELPFIMGVMADLSGKPSQKLPAVSKRDFKNVDADNFDRFLAAQTPRVSFRVPNRLDPAKKDEEINIEIHFQSMKDFEPGQVVENVPALNELLKLRQGLDELLTRLDGKDQAEERLKQLLSNPSLQHALATLGQDNE